MEFISELGRHKADLAIGVNVFDDDLDSVAQAELIFDLVNTTLAADFGDVDQSVAAGHDVHECTEVSDIHDPTLIGLAHFWGWRIEDQLHLAFCFSDRIAISRSNRHHADHAVVVDRDVGAGLGLHSVNDLALRANDLADLVDRDLKANDLRSVLVDLSARFSDCFGHIGQHLQASFECLLKCSGQNVGWDAVDLGVHLQRRNEVRGTTDFKVHVAHRVFSTEDVGDWNVLVTFMDQAHGDTSDWGSDWNTSVHQRQR